MKQSGTAQEITVPEARAQIPFILFMPGFRQINLPPMNLLSSTLAALCCAATMARAQESFPLWEKGAPGALGNSEKDIPTLTVYRPADGKATGAAMVICPGGGYAGLAQHEGKDYAIWLADHGVTGFVLK